MVFIPAISRWVLKFTTKHFDTSPHRIITCWTALCLILTICFSVIVNLDPTGSEPEVGAIKNLVLPVHKTLSLQSFVYVLVYTNTFDTFFVKRDSKWHNSNAIQIRNITDIITWLTNWIIGTVGIVTVTFECYPTVSAHIVMALGIGVQHKTMNLGSEFNQLKMHPYSFLKETLTVIQNVISADWDLCGQDEDFETMIIQD